MEVKYAIRTKTTKKVFPREFHSKEEAEKFRQKRSDPKHWEVVMKMPKVVEGR